MLLECSQEQSRVALWISCHSAYCCQQWWGN